MSVSMLSISAESAAGESQTDFQLSSFSHRALRSYAQSPANTQMSEVHKRQTSGFQQMIWKHHPKKKKKAPSSPEILKLWGKTGRKSCLTSTTALCLISCLLSQPGVAIFRVIPSSSRQQIHSITQGDSPSLCWPITAFKTPAAPGKLWLLEIKTNLREKHCSY